MDARSEEYRVALVGLGPRGLGALEELARYAAETQIAIAVDIFDPVGCSGAGPNFDPGQSDLCLLNIPIRDLDIDPPEFLSGKITSFSKWSTMSYAPDDFPPRSDLGAYLHARFEALIDSCNFEIAQHAMQVTSLKQVDAGWNVATAKEERGPYDEVLISPGQPKTKLDPQMQKWAKHASAHDLDLVTAYPANALIAAADRWAGKTVAVRGLGLSTLDVVRLLTVGLGGRFSDGRYIPSGREPDRILPFSLDGTPPAPKPATQEIDARFNPSKDETGAFVTALQDALDRSPDRALQTICDALLAPGLRIATDLGCDWSQEDVTDWLETERENPGAQETKSAIEALKSGVGMARGDMAPDIGYVFGQIWRKWQNELRSGFNGAEPDAATASAVVGFDEGLKRYSYGPPIAAAQELLCLINQGIVSLCIVDDPAVLLTDTGWQLHETGDALSASVMIDAVLPGPVLADVTDDMIADLVASGTMRPMAEGMGARTQADGLLVDATGYPSKGLSLLGRLALGSVIAADSLHDCFGASAGRWAAGVVERHNADPHG